MVSAAATVGHDDLEQVVSVSFVEYDLVALIVRKLDWRVLSSSSIQFSLIDSRIRMVFHKFRNVK